MSEIQLSEKIKNLKASATLALAAKARELKAEGKDVISLSVGEPDWNSFKVAVDAGTAAIQEGRTKYMPSNGLLELREAIARQVSTDLKIDYTAEQVTVTAGGKFCIYSLLSALINPGDEVIIPAPYWVSYPTIVEMTGGTPVVVDCDKESDFKLTAKKLEQAITPKTKLVILNSPSNPTGEMHTLEELKEIADVLEKHPQVALMSDDIYNRLVFGETKLAPHILHASPQLKSRVLNLNGVSKTYSMTGWRLGWAVGPEPIIKAMSRFQSQTVSCASSMAQWASLAAIENGQPELESSLKELQNRRDQVYSILKDVPGLKVNCPDGAFYFWADVSSHFGKTWNGKKLESSRDFSAYLLESQAVIGVPGIEFGLEGYLRLSYALKIERMKEAVERITRFISELD